MRIRQCVGRNIITSIRYMNIVLIYHICDVIKRMRKYAWSDVSRSSIRFTYSSVARHIGTCICHNSQTYTWNDVIPYKGRMIRVFLALCSDCFIPKQRVHGRHYQGGWVGRTADLDFAGKKTILAQQGIEPRIPRSSSR